MAHWSTTLAGLMIWLFATAGWPPARAEVRHVVVFAEHGQFGGWPAGHGIWHWGEEILVGFSIGSYKASNSGHDIDREQPEHHVLARSRDGGATWQLEYPARRGMLINLGGMRKGITDPSLREPSPRPITQPLDFAHRSFCMTLRLQRTNGGSSRLYYSYDRGHQWLGPFQLPMFGQPGVMARTDYLVNGNRDCHVFLTVAKRDQREGRVISVRTRDGGIHWDFLGYVGPEPAGFSIMPATVRLSPEHLLMATRRRSGPQEPPRRWIDIWRSSDNGQQWEFVADAVEDCGRGNPPALLRLADGRLCLTYGVRRAPYEICGKFSGDNGRTWSLPRVLRSGGGGPDLGYTRTIQRPDGKLVTVYYYLPQESPFPQIEAAIWEP